MNIKTLTGAFLIGFVGLCVFLVVESGVFDKTSVHATAPIVRLANDNSFGILADEEATEDLSQSYDLTILKAINAARRTETIGSIHEDTGFKFELELSNKGAAIVRATLSEFLDRDPKNPAPLEVLSPVEVQGKELYSLAGGNLQLIDQKQPFPLNKLNWQVVEDTGDKLFSQNDSQKVTFQAILSDAAGKDIIKITKTYALEPDSYHVNCDIALENLSDSPLNVKELNLQGPVGIKREAARNDMRGVIAAFVKPDGKIGSVKKNNNKFRSAKRKRDSEAMLLKHKNAGARFIWAAITNKYFAAILRPVPQEGKDLPQGIKLGAVQYYDPGLADKKPDGDENSSFSLQVMPFELAAAGEENSANQFGFELYLGPKDKDVFANNPQYKKLGFYHTISFLGCCCPGAIITPMAFAVIGSMKWIYGFIPNYGIVIMIVVFIVRLCLHPVTKKSQVSMMKMQKLGPMMEEIKKKYASNKAEMNKHVMALYREQGVSPAMSFLPMLLQMPILIALYSAIYANIELRSAAFLPVWITDLSAPDALITFSTFTVPMLGWQISSFNLLPVLLSVVMVLQQKLMPHASSKAASPQIAQQQKMMLVMMPVMMLFIFYKAPSGLNLYFMSSTFCGLVEQIIIRKHIREKEEAQAIGMVPVTSKTGGKVKKKKPKPFYKGGM